MPTFADLLTHAYKQLQSDKALTDYWNGYIRGLRTGNTTTAPPPFRLLI